jgi:hypothetical protein
MTDNSNNNVHDEEDEEVTVRHGGGPAALLGAAMLPRPLLARLAQAEWRRFKANFLVYRASNGPASLQQCLSPDVMAYVEERLASEKKEVAQLSSAELVAELDGFWGACDVHDVIRELAPLRMVDSSTVDIDALVAYSLAFTVTLRDAKMKPEEDGLTRHFLSGLYPMCLRRRVAMTNPQTLQEAKVTAMSEAKQIQYWERELRNTTAPSIQGYKVSSVPTAAVQPKSKTPEQPQRKVFPQASGGQVPKGTVKCFGCGGEGHKMAECPKREPGSGSGAAKRENTKMVKNGESLFMALAAVTMEGVGTVPTRVVLDTGSTINIISPSWLQQLPAGFRSTLGSVRPAEVAIVEDVTLVAKGAVKLDCSIQAWGSTAKVSDVFQVMTLPDCDMVLSDRVSVNHGFLRGALDERQTVRLGEPEEVDDEGGGVEGGVADWCQTAVDSFADVFEVTLPREGAKLPPLEIKTKPGFVPPREPLRVLAKGRADALDELVAKGLATGIFAAGIGPASSPPHVFPKPKDPGVYRMTVDFRKLNEGVVDISYPLPNAEKSIAVLGGHQYFCKLDLREGYHQVLVREEDRWMTAFLTRQGAFQYCRIPMGLKTAPAYFQHLMASVVLHGLEGRTCVVFIDDVVIFADTQSEMLERLISVLERFRHYNLRLKLSKCSFGQTAVQYLGFRIDGEGVRLDDERRRALRELQPPTTAKGMRSFLGLLNFFRKLVPHFATKAQPLYDLVKKRGPIVLTEGELKVFAELREEVAKSPVMKHLDYGQPIYLRCDASDVGVGAMLYQIGRDGQVRPVFFLSRAFKGAELRWATIEKEMFAIYWSILKLETQLLGQRFVVETDHRNLVYMQNSQAPKVIRWRLRLAEFDFVVNHIDGVENVVADGLSRCLLIADVADRRRSLEAHHNAVAGHLSAAVLVDKLQAAGAVWEGMEEDARKFVHECGICQKTAPQRESARLHGAPYTTAGTGVFTDLQFDHIGPLVTDDDGHKHILVFICQLSRFVVLFPTKSKDAEETAACLLKLVCMFRVPERVNSDRGGAFVSQVLADYAILLGTKHTLHTPYHHQESGMVERANRSVMHHLRALVMEARVKNQWSVFLPLVQRIINTSIHRVIGVAPIQLVFSAAFLDQEMRTHLVVTENPAQTDKGQRLVEAENALLAVAKNNQQDFVLSTQGRQTQPVSPLPEWVLVLRDSPHKLAPKWKGPSRVLKGPNSTGVIEVQDLTTRKTVATHISRVKPFLGDTSKEAALLALAELDEDEYVIEQITDHLPAKLTGPKKGWTFRVKWQGYPEEYDEWLPYAEVKDTEALGKYLAQRG